MSIDAPWHAARFMWSHPAHALAMGFGAGLSPKAPGTVGTLWAWAAYVVLGLFLSTAEMGWLIAICYGLVGLHRDRPTHASPRPQRHRLG